MAGDETPYELVSEAALGREFLGKKKKKKKDKKSPNNLEYCVLFQLLSTENKIQLTATSSKSMKDGICLLLKIS